jgi:hypothetical protein
MEYGVLVVYIEYRWYQLLVPLPVKMKLLGVLEYVEGLAFHVEVFGKIQIRYVLSKNESICIFSDVECWEMPCFVRFGGQSLRNFLLFRDYFTCRTNPTGTSTSRMTESSNRFQSCLYRE